MLGGFNWVENCFSAQNKNSLLRTGNPQITFYKVIYRRHTNFSMESIEQTFNGTADFGRKVTCTISRNGDLITRVWLQAEIPDIVLSGAPLGVANMTGFCWTAWLGHALIRSVEIEIGGQKIDKHYAEWLHIWNELSQTAGHALGYANLVGNTPDLTTLSTSTGLVAGAGPSVTIKGKILYVPLQFWFCRNPGLALPLIALKNVGQKSIQPSAFERCSGENLLESRGLSIFDKGQSQMLVSC